MRAQDIRLAMRWALNRSIGMRFVFPLDAEVPYGQVMLGILLDRGFVPEIVIEEESPEAEHHRTLFLERLGGAQLAPTIASQVEKHGLR